MLQHKESVSKKAFFSAEELAKELNVKKFLVKSWEREFRVTPEHPAGGSKCYSQENLKTFVAIKDLLLNKKMTFSQAKRVLGAREQAAPVQPVEPVQVTAPVIPEAAVALPVAADQDSTVTVVEAPVAEQAAASIGGVQAASVSEDAMVEAVEIETAATGEVAVAPVAQDDLVQPAVMPQEAEVEPQVTPVHHERFMQKIQDFKKQLLDFKEQLDLE